MARLDVERRDILERLRTYDPDVDSVYIAGEAADEIARLRAALPAEGELLVRIPEGLAPHMIQALESLADLVEQRHGATRMVGLGRLMAESIRSALLGQ